MYMLTLHWNTDTVQCIYSQHSFAYRPTSDSRPFSLEAYISKCRVSFPIYLVFLTITACASVTNGGYYQAIGCQYLTLICKNDLKPWIQITWEKHLHFFTHTAVHRKLKTWQDIIPAARTSEHYRKLYFTVELHRSTEISFTSPDFWTGI